MINEFPDLFPEEIQSGYQLHGKISASIKQNIEVRRINITSMERGIFQIYPAFVMPYMTERTDEAWKILFLSMYRVPEWVLAKVFDKDEKHIQRLQSHLGNCSLVGSTVRGVTKVPEHLVADEKHSRLNGEKAYIAMISAKDCFLCSGVTNKADEKELTDAYEKFEKQAEDIEPAYQAKTVNTDGWQATGNALKKVLGKSVKIISCFLHALLSIKNVSTKKSKKIFSEVKEKVWNIYKSKDKHTFSQRIRRLREFASSISDSRIEEQVLKLCKKKYSFMTSYDFSKAHRTSNMIDRLMDFTDKFLYNHRFSYINYTLIIPPKNLLTTLT
jgi:hypothetical protein